MKLLTTENEVRNRVKRAQGAAIVLTAFIFIMGLTSPAHAQSAHGGGGGGGGAGKVVFQDVNYVGSVGVARDQMLRITVPIPDNQSTATGKLFLATDVGVYMAHVKVFDGLATAQIDSFDLREPPPGLHTFDIGGSGRDLLLGGTGDDAGRSRVQLLVSVKLVLRYDPRLKTPGEGIFAPIIEVVDKLSGKTTVWGTLNKVGPGTLLLNNNTSSY